MHVVWSHEFLVAMLSFLAPVAIGAGLVYRRILKSDLWHRRARKEATAACLPAVAVAPTVEQQAGSTRELDVVKPAEPPVVQEPVPAVPVTVASLRQPMANLRQRLVEFRTSIQQSRSALKELQECDSRFSLDLSRASEVMHHAFPH